MKILRFVIILYLFTLYSCAIYESPVNTVTISSYIFKASGFLSVVIILLGAKKIFWRSVYSRLYYFYFTLAQIKYIFAKYKLPVQHGDVWRESN